MCVFARTKRCSAHTRQIWVASSPGPRLIKAAALKPTADEVPTYQPDVVHYRIRPDDFRPIRFAKTGVASKEMTPPETIVDTFKRAVARHGDSPALKVERPMPPLDASGKAPPALPENEWTTWTWQQYYDEAREVAKGLIALGVERMEGVAVYGFNSPEWLIAQTGIVMAGALVAGVYPTDNTEALAFKTMHCGARVAIVDDAAKVERYRTKLDELAKLTAIVVYSPAYASDGATVARTNGSQVKILSWLDVRMLGASATDDVVNERIASLKPEECASLIYTSGTTGRPKAVMCTHDNMVFEGNMSLQTSPTFGAAGQDRALSYLPLSHIAGLMVDWVIPMTITAQRPGYCTTYFARSYDLKVGSLVERMRAVQPTMFFGPPRVFEKIADKISAQQAGLTGAKKWIVDWSRSVALEYAANCELGGSGLQPTSYARADRMVYSKVRAALGLDQAKLVWSGAAPVQKATMEFFAGMGINLNETYGMSESTGSITLGTDDCHVWGSVGGVVPGCEVKVLRREGETWVEAATAKDMFKPTEEEQGELCYRGRNIMLGYMSSPALGDAEEITRKNVDTIDREGFLHSGDKGCVNAQGMFRVTGRYKELIIGSGGENIAPVPIEDRVLALAPAISKAVMIGDKRKFNVMLITLKQEGTTGETPGTGALTGPALAVSPASKTTSEAIDDPVWEAYVTKVIDTVNKDGNVVVSNAYRVEKFTILPHDVSMEGGELTSTMKLKRNVVDEKYVKQIDRFYLQDAHASSKYVKWVP